jgi:hypothetical protein
MNKTETVAAATLVETVEVPTVTIEESFYVRLVDIAYFNFSRVDFKEIRETFERQVSYCESVKQLIEVADTFVKDREFISTVDSEHKRLHD